MTKFCGCSTSHLDRRTVGLGLAALVAMPGFARAAAPKTPPKPGNVLSPDQAMTRLFAGNERYVKGHSKRHDFKSEREALAGGQNPYAAILSCADSRVAPEYAFDSARGDLFVVRIAGNFVNDTNLASLEYGVEVLKAPLILVLGHADCGALIATIASLKDKTTLPGHLPSLVTSLAGAVEAVAGKPGDQLANATRENVRRNVEALRTATPLLSAAVNDNRLKIVGGYYNLNNGVVERL